MGDAFRIKITNGALADLEGIFDHVQTDSPQNAAGLIERILDDIDRLALLPTRHPVAGNSRRTGLPVYKLVVKPFLVYYRVDLRRKALFVMEVRHGAMRQPTRFD
ncbi:MAG TPA: type II toxin-antitoxin system RelE/ParE family toxin [Tepidisphaeraceae bacterium]|jgi:plasmid stabilization system protein ParE|nr:type II toxin-antitoxin system RelE/ParE family toxin [Tepidisphaeraceae bacterium]